MTPDIKSRIDALTPNAGLQHVPAIAGQAAEEFHTLVRRSDMHAAIEAVTGSEMSNTNTLPELPDNFYTHESPWREILAWHSARCGDEAHATAADVDEALRQMLRDYAHRALEAYDLGARSTAAQPLTLSHEEIDRVFNEHEEAPQISYRYWVANALLAAANEKSPTAAAQPPGWVDEAAGQIEHLDRENNRLAREAWTWSKACEAATRKLHILSTHHPRLEVRYWTGSYWEPMYGVALDRLLETLAPAPHAASGDSTPASEPEWEAWAQQWRVCAETICAMVGSGVVVGSPSELVAGVMAAIAAQADPTGALRPEPEAVGQGRWISVDERMPENDDEVLVWVTGPWSKKPYAAIDSWHLHREDPTGMGGPTLEMGYMWREYEAQDITHWKRVEPPQATSGSMGD